MNRHLEVRWRADARAVHRSVELARRNGQLVEERWLDAPAPGWADVVVTLRPGQLPPAPRRRRASRWRTVGLTAGGGLAIGVGWALWWLLSWVVAHWAELLGGAALILLVWIGLGQLGACPGVHCPGCKHS